MTDSLAGLECVLTPLGSGLRPQLQPPLFVDSWDMKEEQPTLKGMRESYFSDHFISIPFHL